MKHSAKICTGFLKLREALGRKKDINNISVDAILFIHKYGSRKSKKIAVKIAS